MLRLFCALALPQPIRDHLTLVQGGIPGARWVPAANLHLTLRFLGELEGAQLIAVRSALDALTYPSFPLTLARTGHFPPRGQPRSVWAGVETREHVDELHCRIERLLANTGIPPDPRKFHPHVTLARLRRSPPAKVARFLADHALFRTATFTAEAVTLYASIRSPSGSKYRVEAVVRLGGRS